MMAELRAVTRADDGDQVVRLHAWLKAAEHRTHDVEGECHVLRERGVLLARNRVLALALGTAERRAGPS
jgi:hypothetical protein